MNRLEEEREAAGKIVRPRQTEAVKAAETNRALIAEARGAIELREEMQRLQRRADLAKGEYATCDEIVAAARKL